MWRRLILCLLLGMFTTVAVAWSVAAWVDMSRAKSSDYSYWPRTANPPDSDSTVPWWWWRVVHMRAFGSERVIMVGYHDPSWPIRFNPRIPRRAIQAITSDEARDNADTAQDEWMVLDARGWPCVALAAEWPWWTWPGGQPPPTAGAIPLPGHPVRNGFRQGALRALPLTPLWRGLVLDIGFYGLLWWLILAGVSAMRRLTRRGRGRCAGCGYNLDGLARGGAMPGVREACAGDRVPLNLG